MKLQLGLRCRLRISASIAADGSPPKLSPLEGKERTTGVIEAPARNLQFEFMRIPQSELRWLQQICDQAIAQCKDLGVTPVFARTNGCNREATSWEHEAGGQDHGQVLRRGGTTAVRVGLWHPCR